MAGVINIHTHYTINHTLKENITHIPGENIPFQMRESPRYSSQQDSVLFKYKHRLIIDLSWFLI